MYLGHPLKNVITRTVFKPKIDIRVLTFTDYCNIHIILGLFYSYLKILMSISKEYGFKDRHSNNDISMRMNHLHFYITYPL